MVRSNRRLQIKIAKHNRARFALNRRHLQGIRAQQEMPSFDALAALEDEHGRLRRFWRRNPVHHGRQLDDLHVRPATGFRRLLTVGLRCHCIRLDPSAHQFRPQHLFAAGAGNLAADMTFTCDYNVTRKTCGLKLRDQVRVLGQNDGTQARLRLQVF